jgi:hypothetical protein
MLSSRLKKFLLAGSAALVIFIVTLHVTDVCRLDAVTLNGEVVPDFEKQYGLTAGAMVTNQPLSDLADQLLADDEIRKIDIAVDLPGGVAITTNQFEPDALVLSERTGKLYGLEAFGRVVPLPDGDTDWERPLLVNARVAELYERCDDVRVPMVLDELAELREENPDLYRLVAEVDLAAADHVVVTVSGLPYTLWATGNRLAEQLSEFVRFIHLYAPDMGSVKRVDLRFRDMIVCGTKG